MTNDELDEWCNEMSGTVFIDEEINTVMMLVKETVQLSLQVLEKRKYKMRLFNLSYMAIGTAKEERIIRLLEQDYVRIVGKFQREEIEADEFLKELKAARTYSACYIGGDN